MEAPDSAFLKHTLAKVSPEVIARGVKLYTDLHYYFEASPTKKAFTVRVPSATSGRNYSVKLSGSVGYDSDYPSCNCPAFSTYGPCKHIAAAILHLLKKEDPEILSQYQEQYGIGRHHNGNSASDRKIKSPARTSPEWVLHSSPLTILDDLIGPDVDSQFVGDAYNFKTKYNQLTAKFKVSLEAHGQGLQTSVEFNHPDKFILHCGCNEPRSLCSHLKNLLKEIRNQHGNKVFCSFYPQAVKDQLLAEIGVRPNDPAIDDFVFTANYHGKPAVITPSWVITDNESLKKFTERVNKPINRGNEKGPSSLRAGILVLPAIHLSDSEEAAHVGFNWGLIKATPQKQNLKYYFSDELNSATALLWMEILDPEVRASMEQCSTPALNQWLKKKGAKSWQMGPGNRDFYLPEAYSADFISHYHAISSKIWQYLENRGKVMVRMSEQNKPKSKILKEYAIEANPIKVSFTYEERNNHILIRKEYYSGDRKLDEKTIRKIGPFFILENSVIHFVREPESVHILSTFEDQTLRFPMALRSSVLSDLIPGLMKKASVHLPESISLVEGSTEPEKLVYLKELDDKFLLIEPKCCYGQNEFHFLSDVQDEVYALQDQNTIYKLCRAPETERAHYELVRSSHPSFSRQGNKESFYLSFQDTRKDHWLIQFVHQMNEAGATVYGFDNLKHLRYATKPPTFKVSTESGIDWFDLHIEVAFGDQKVSYDTLRNAIRHQERGVVLSDGSLGILPEEWLKKYFLLFRMGEAGKKGKLRIPKIQFALLDAVSDDLKEQTIKTQLEELKRNLVNLEGLKKAKPDKSVKSILRPYQTYGFEWMQMLDQLGWGGMLADDMGLGKTLQTITFLLYLKAQKRGEPSLVICPTSLIFNWQSELKKFAPSLRFIVHYGLDRSFNKDEYVNYDVVISSYGVVRSDIDQLSTVQWNYIILDESQAIKNPESLTAKALAFLKSRNRLALSGTPIQNNTFDLYSQMNFLNPGLLGNKSFFREEFARAIDRDNDTSKSEHLRKMVHPFILRRTKEQVAADLPEKTEITLWCEMPREQRQVYDEYKNYYRNSLLNKIDEIGMEKSGVYILEGMLRLRQICDSPQLIESPDTKEMKGIKVAELMREIDENLGAHKMLVFSQFTSMLDIIERELADKAVGFVRLDGKTSQSMRKEAVDQFQNDPSVSIFLLSLKAGGTGLNLTAADYVFLVDPWWNPATEQQAIDRTHRIGQVNKVFAYRMICRDSIEEKIIGLQNKKQSVSGALIGEDASAFKKLKKEDIEYLFG